MVPTFARLLEQAPASNLSLTISIFYTRAIQKSAPHEFGILPDRLTLSPGRPRLQRSLESVVERTCEVFGNTYAGGRPRGVFVGACGPAALTEEASNVVRSFGREKFCAVGGVEAQEEYVMLRVCF